MNRNLRLRARWKDVSYFFLVRDIILILMQMCSIFLKDFNLNLHHLPSVYQCKNVLQLLSLCTIGYKNDLKILGWNSYGFYLIYNSFYKITHIFRQNTNFLFLFWFSFFHASSKQIFFLLDWQKKKCVLWETLI